mmetsp:Transcript_26389/g.88408  ORF Transcript_26389/g.88408 Transcript_26389/m.88408 type:complete len:366 (-) Transcript_26389:613-1710(-)
MLRFERCTDRPGVERRLDTVHNIVSRCTRIRAAAVTDLRQGHLSRWETRRLSPRPQPTRVRSLATPRAATTGMSTGSPRLQAGSVSSSKTALASRARVKATWRWYKYAARSLRCAHSSGGTMLPSGRWQGPSPVGLQRRCPTGTGAVRSGSVAPPAAARAAWRRMPQYCCAQNLPFQSCARASGKRDCGRKPGGGGPGGNTAGARPQGRSTARIPWARPARDRYAATSSALRSASVSPWARCASSNSMPSGKAVMRTTARTAPAPRRLARRTAVEAPPPHATKARGSGPCTSARSAAATSAWSRPDPRSRSDHPKPGGSYAHARNPRPARLSWRPERSATPWPGEEVIQSVGLREGTPSAPSTQR